MNDLRQKKKMGYTPVIIGLCFLMVFTCLGFCSSPKSLFIVPVTESLGIDRSTYSWNDSCRYIATSVINIFFGSLLHRFGPRKLIAAGFASLAISSLLYAVAENVFTIYLGGCLLGIGLSWTTTTMVGSVVNRWCFEKKGTIMGAILAANGLGGALATQIVSPIIESGAEGYRKAYVTVAVILLCVGLLITVLFRDKPADAPDSTENTSKSKKRGATHEGLEFSKAKRKAFFYIAAVCIFVTGLVLQGITGVAAAHLKDAGLDAGFVATILSVHSLTLAFFKFSTGIIYDKFGLRVTTGICCMTAVVVMILLSMVTNTVIGMTFAVIYATFSSLALPLETIMLPIYAGDLFGERSFNQVLGIFVSVNTAGYALGAPLINLCYDKFGTYVPGFYAGAALMLLVTIGVQTAITLASKARREAEIEA
ncbi:MAG: MFS transporter [Clostridia bacterium]|nr:MFS transporter [Clostridia bacterium]